MSAGCKPRVQLLTDVGDGWLHSALRYHKIPPLLKLCTSSANSRYTGPLLIHFVLLTSNGRLGLYSNCEDSHYNLHPVRIC